MKAINLGGLCQNCYIGILVWWSYLLETFPTNGIRADLGRGRVQPAFFASMDDLDASDRKDFDFEMLRPFTATSKGRNLSA
jgi:hypothetical protein